MTDTTVTETTTRAVIDVPLDQLRPSDANPRENVGDVEGLAASIAALGILEPLLVRPVEPFDDGVFEVLAGERRLAAAHVAGLATAPCLVLDAPLDDVDVVELMIVENMQRHGFTPLEEAAAFAHLQRLGRSQRDIAGRVGKSQAHVSRRLALLVLPDVAHAAIEARTITLDQAVDLASLVDDRDRFDKVVATIGSAAFDGRLRVEVTERRREQDRAARVAELREDGHEVFTSWRHEQVLSDPDGVEISVEDHEGEPCHAAGVGANADVIWLCTDRARHAPHGDSDVKALNMTAPAAPPSGSAPALPASQASPSPSAGAPASRLEGSDDQAAPAGDESAASEQDGLDLPPAVDTPPLLDVPKSAFALEREANVARRDDFLAVRPQRRQRVTDYMAKGNPAKGPVVKFFAAQLADEPFVAANAPLFRALLGLDADVDLAEYVAKGDTQATRFALVFGFALMEAEFDGLPNHAFNGLPAGAYADDRQIARHYDFLRDLGWVPKPAEAALLEPPDDTAPEADTVEALDGVSPVDAGQGTAPPPADAGDTPPPEWLTCDLCGDFGAVSEVDADGAVTWQFCPAGHEPRRKGDPDFADPPGTGYWFTDDPDPDAIDLLVAHVAPHIPAATCIAPDCDADAKGTRGFCATHVADPAYHPETCDALALAVAQPDKLRAPLEDYHAAEVLAPYIDAAEG